MSDRCLVKGVQDCPRANVSRPNIDHRIGPETPKEDFLGIRAIPGPQWHCPDGIQRREKFLWLWGHLAGKGRQSSATGQALEAREIMAGALNENIRFGRLHSVEC